MATATDRLLFRQMIDEPDDSDGWTDTRVDSYLDANDTIEAAAAAAWSVKAAATTGLVDVSESGSSRKLGDVHKHALEMAAHYGSKTVGGAASSSGPIVVQRLRRGF